MNHMGKVALFTMLWMAACGSQVTVDDHDAGSTGGSGGGGSAGTTATGTTSTAAQGGGGWGSDDAEAYCADLCEDLLAFTPSVCSLVKTCEYGLSFCTEHYTEAVELGCLKEFLALTECIRKEVTTIKGGCGGTCSDQQFANEACKE